MKIQWQWPGAIAFAVVFATFGLLVWQNRVPVEVLIALLAAAGLSPSPLLRTPPKPAETKLVTVSDPSQEH